MCHAEGAAQTRGHEDAAASHGNGANVQTGPAVHSSGRQCCGHKPPNHGGEANKGSGSVNWWHANPGARG